MKKYTARWIANAIGEEAEIVGDDNIEISAAIGLDGADDNSVTFAVGRKNYKLLKETSAVLAIVGLDAPDDLGCTLIKVAKPEVAFVKIAQAIAPRIPHDLAGIHERAVISNDVNIGNGVAIGANTVIEEGAEIGANTIIYPGVYIGKGVKIGDDTIMYANVSVYYGCTIGSGVIIHSGAVIGADGFGFQWDGSEHLKIPQTGIVEIQDKVEIGANSTIDRGRFASTVIEKGCKIDNLVHIAHNCKIGANSVFAALVGVSGSVDIGKGVAVGGQVGFADHIKVGDGCTFYAKSGVASDVEPGQIMVGQPAVEYRQEYKRFKNIRGIDKLKEKIGNIEKKLEEIINETDDA